MMIVRGAFAADVPGIMEVERRTFGGVSSAAMASEIMMRSRIDLLNSKGSPWFLVAINDEETVAGYVILQPTNVDPDSCTSWSGATDGGTLRETFDPEGANVYVVSLAVSADADDGTVSLLLVRAAFERWAEGGGFLMFCSRMPGYARARTKSGIDPETYMRLRHADGAPRDPMLRLYWAVSGEVEPRRLLRDGFPPDAASGGHGALFALDDSARALRAVNELLEHKRCHMEPIIQITDSRVVLLQGGRHAWWDVAESRFVDAVTVYIPFGCPDWGETGGRRNSMCTFCDLPNAVIGYREAFYGGHSIESPEHVAVFAATLRGALVGHPSPHTIMIFNAGSFLAMDPELRGAVIEHVAGVEGLRRVVIESRANLVTRDSLLPIVEALADHGIGLTVRIGVEAENDHLRLTVLRKGHTRQHLFAATEIIRSCGALAGGYVLLNPAPGLDPEWAMEECLRTFDFVLDKKEGCLGMDEAYFCSTNVGSPFLRKEWEAGRFAPASLWMVYHTLMEGILHYGTRIHLLPFHDVPALVAVPSNHVHQGIPEDLTGAMGCDLEFHRMLDRYRGTMDATTLIPPECACRPSWQR